MKLFDSPTIRLTPSWTEATRANPRRALVKNSQGLILFREALWVGGRELAHQTAVSGQSFAQLLLKCTERRAGCASPIGEGVYQLGDADATRRVNWASGKPGDFSGSWGAGLGPWWVGIHPTAGYPCDTHDYGLHSDWNEDTAPGSLGCVTTQGETGPRDLERLKRLNGWFQAYDIAFLVIDHGLGSVPRPPV